MRLGAHLDVVGPEGHGGAVGEHEVVGAVGVEGAFDHAAVGVQERVLHQRHLPADPRRQRLEVGEHRVLEQALEVGDRFELLDVERVGHLGRDRVGERLAPRLQDQRPPERLADLELGLVAGRQAERHHGAGALHLGFERVVECSGVDGGPVGQVHRLASTGQIAVELVGDERAERREQQRERREALVQGGVSRRVVRASRSGRVNGGRTSSTGRRRSRRAPARRAARRSPRARR